MNRRPLTARPAAMKNFASPTAHRLSTQRLRVSDALLAATVDRRRCSSVAGSTESTSAQRCDVGCEAAKRMHQSCAAHDELGQCRRSSWTAPCRGLKTVRRRARAIDSRRETQPSQRAMPKSPCDPESGWSHQGRRDQGRRTRAPADVKGRPWETHRSHTASRRRTRATDLGLRSPSTKARRV